MGLLLARTDPGAAQGVPAQNLAVEIEATIDAPPLEVRATLLDLDRYGEWFPNTVQWKVLERQPGSLLAYGRLYLPWPVDDRDYVVRYQWSEDQRVPFRLRAVATPAGGPPVSENVVRVEQMTTTWEVAPLGSGTFIRYLYEGSPGGLLPDWVFEIGWEMQTGVLMEALERQIERRREAKKGGAAGASRPRD